jgi:hypothetical protein
MSYLHHDVGNTVRASAETSIRPDTECGEDTAYMPYEAVPSLHTRQLSG